MSSEFINTSLSQSLTCLTKTAQRGVSCRLGFQICPSTSSNPAPHQVRHECCPPLRDTRAPEQLQNFMLLEAPCLNLYPTEVNKFQMRRSSRGLVSASLTFVSPSSFFKRKSPFYTSCCTHRQRVCTCRRRPSPRREPTANPLDESARTTTSAHMANSASMDLAP